MQSTIFCENLGTIEEYTEETIVILNNMIQNKMSEDKDVLYEWIIKRFDGKINRDETKKLFQENPEEVKRMLVDLLDKPWRAGLEQGLEQGQAQLRREIARTQRKQVFKMLRDGLPIDRIHEYTELSGDEIRAFQKNGQE